MRYTVHFQYLNEDEDEAWACHAFLTLLKKLRIGVHTATIHTAWGGGDTTLSVEYKLRVEERPLKSL